MEDTESDHAERIFERTLRFDDGTVLNAAAWNVPEQPAYPDGVHYRFHFGSSEGTVVRYDNAHAGRHERHDSDGTIETIEFPGVIALYQQFLQEVANWRRRE
jgi:hypothetical protein